MVKTVVSTNRRINRADDWLFGEPTLATANLGRARWVKGSTSPLDQKGATGWLADLYGGVQSGDDWARVNVPVNELPIRKFTSAMWTYYMTNTEAAGVNIVIWVHDPNDLKKRAEITQTMGKVGLAAGWNVESLSSSTSELFYYGENVGSPNICITTGTEYTWAQYQADKVFSTWTIYRITIEYGWIASSTLESAFVAEIVLNGVSIPLQPATPSHKKTIVVSKALVAATAYDIGDVMSEATSGGTDWDFDFGGTGYITKAVLVSATTALTAAVVVMLYSAPPTCELDDHAANTGPLAADVPYFLGHIIFPAMVDIVAAPSFAIVTPSLATGNLPLSFDAPTIYAVVITNSAQDFLDGTALTLSLSADMDD